MRAPSGETWSAPDEDGIMTCRLDVGAVSTLRGRRKRRGTRSDMKALSLWPTTWRDLVKDWLKQGSAKRKWQSLQKTAGAARINEAWQVLDSLLKAGLIEIEENRINGLWQPLWVEFFDLETLREQVGLSNRDRLQNRRQEQRDSVFLSPEVEALRSSLDGMPDNRAVLRYELLAALDAWISEERCGTRRDFALFAKGDTKGVSAAEWTWLENGIALDAFGISPHTPAVWLRAPLSLSTPNGVLDLRSVPDFIALTPDTFDRITSLDGQIGCWRILENRTVFEKVAKKYGDIDGIIWVPGFAASWWMRAIGTLLDFCPRPAMIACDPDPAGVEITLNIGKVWSSTNASWTPWKMDIETLSSLPRHKSLNDDDGARLQRLLTYSLPPVLNDLLLWMAKNQKKGEQENIIY